MASSSKVNFNHQSNNKFGTVPNHIQADMEVTQDLHLKMSKKIAQLTKVIYALNTKNDEHEAIVQNIRDQYEEQMHQLRSETSQRIAFYRDQVQSGTNGQADVIQREANDAKFQKEKLEIEILQLKSAADEREEQLKTNFAQKVCFLTDEMQAVKRQLSAKIDQFDAIKVQLGKEKVAAIEELKSHYEKKLQDLEQSQQSIEGTLEATTDSLKKQFQDEILRLEETIKGLKHEQNVMEEEYQSKLQKAKAFYEKELDALKCSSAEKEKSEISELKAQMQKLKQDSKHQENLLQQKIQKLLEELTDYEEELFKYKKELKELQNNVSDKDSTSNLLNTQLQHAKGQVDTLTAELKKARSDLGATLDKCEYQGKDLVVKSAQIGELEAIKIQNEATVNDLRNQLKRLSDRLGILEGAKRALESQVQTQNQEQLNHIKELEKSLEEMSSGKQDLAEKYDKDLRDATDKLHRMEQNLKEQHEKALRDLENRLSNSSTLRVQELMSELETLKETTETRLASEIRRLTRERDSIQKEYEQTKKELQKALDEARSELETLKKAVLEREQGLGSATSQMTALQQAHDKIKQELVETKEKLQGSIQHCAVLQSELEELRSRYNNAVQKHTIDMEDNLDQLRQDLESLWSKRLLDECMQLRHELQQQKEEDKRQAINDVLQNKSDEMEAMRKSWERKVHELLTEISSLKEMLARQGDTTQEEIEKMNRVFEEEKYKLQEQLRQINEEAAKKIASIESTYKSKLKELADSQDRELSALEDTLKQKHEKSLQDQLNTQRLSVQTLKDQMDKAKDHKIAALKEEHKRQINELEHEMENKAAFQRDEIERVHYNQLAAARMELDRALEISKIKGAEAAMHLSESEEKVRHREQAIKGLEKEIHRLQKDNTHIIKERDESKEEIRQMRLESERSLVHLEERLNNVHQLELDEMDEEYRSAKDVMLKEFGDAQNILKARIREMEVMLLEANQRYEDRDSRPEDLDMIKQLRNAIHDREDMIRKIEDEKKYFQLELVNREKNFNKMFNNDPKVGVLNPLQKKSTKAAVPNDKRSFNSSPTVGSGGHHSPQKLDPIPGLPMHEKLNHLNPIPPPKKFVK